MVASGSSLIDVFVVVVFVFVVVALIGEVREAGSKRDRIMRLDRHIHQGVGCSSRSTRVPWYCVLAALRAGNYISTVSPYRGIAQPWAIGRNKSSKIQKSENIYFWSNNKYSIGVKM